MLGPLQPTHAVARGTLPLQERKAGLLPPESPGAAPPENNSAPPGPTRVPARGLRDEKANVVRIVVPAGFRPPPTLPDPPPSLNFRQRHPVLSVSLNACVRDTVGQTSGRIVYLLLYSLLASAMFHDDDSVQTRRRILMVALGGLFAFVVALCAGRRTAIKLSAVVHQTSEGAHRASRLKWVGVVPPLATSVCIALSGRWFGLRGASLATANSVARICQFYGRDTAGQSWVSRTQYNPDGWSPGYGLVVLRGRDPLAAVDPAAARRFQFGRLGVATALYGLACILTYLLVPRLQSELFQRESHDVSLEAFMGANLGAALASIGLEMVDAVTGVLAYPILARCTGHELALDSQPPASFDLPRAILQNGHARLAFNALHEVFSPVIEQAQHPALAVVLRTFAQTVTEPRGFVDANGRTILDRWDRQAREQAVEMASLREPPQLRWHSAEPARETSQASEDDIA